MALLVLGGSAPATTAKPAGKKHAVKAAQQAADIAPGQMKKAAAATVSALAALVRQAADASAVAAPATKTKKNAQPAKEARKAAKRASAPAAGSPSPAVAAPAAVIAPATPAPTPVPAAGAAPRAPSAQAPRGAAQSAARSRRRERTAPRTATAGGARRTTTQPPGDAARTAVATAPGRARDRPPARADAASDSPLPRTVVRVLEVVPFGLRVALGVLAGLGLLLGAAAAVQTVRRRGLERQRRALLSDVGVLQSALLPQLPARIGGVSVTAAYRPAEGLAAGGDFYDAFALPGGRTGVLVGDVAGHGRAVVPLTALVRYNVRAFLEAGLSPRATVHVAANVLAPHLGELQVTLVVAIFDPGTGRLTYACAGHPPPLLLGGSTSAPVTACSSPPLGAGAATGRRQTTIAFAPGAVACLYTDGLDEAPLPYGRLGRDGLADDLRAVGPQPQAADLIARVVRRSERQPDDMAACILSALPGGAAGWSLRLEELEVDRPTLSSGWAQRFLIACGVEPARIAKALREAHAVIAWSGTAVVEVRVGEALAEVRVTPPPAITLPIAARTEESRTAQAA